MCGIGYAGRRTRRDDLEEGVSAVEKPLGVGIHYDVPEHVYHSDPTGRPSLSVSIASTLCNETPAHAYLRHPRLGGAPKEPTEGMDHGTLVHALLLGKGRTIRRIEAKDWRKDVTKEAREAALGAGEIPVLAAALDAAEESVRIIRTKLTARGVCLTGKSEVVLIWDESLPDGRVVRCRGMLDHLILDDGIIYDLKNTASANPSKLEPKMTDYGYDMQSVAYQRGLAKVAPELAGRTRFEFLFVEAEAPYCVTPVECDGELAALGLRRWQRALHTWADCLERDEWPEYTSSTLRLGPKPWAVMAEDSHGFNYNGL